MQAAYRVTGITNFGGTAFPSGFVFEEYAPTGGPSPHDTKKLRRAEVTVAAFRPVCSRKNLLPEDDEEGRGQYSSGTCACPTQPLPSPRTLRETVLKWVSVAEARKLAERMGTQPKTIADLPGDIVRRAAAVAACGDHPEIG